LYPAELKIFKLISGYSLEVILQSVPKIQNSFFSPSTESNSS